MRRTIAIASIYTLFGSVLFGLPQSAAAQGLVSGKPQAFLSVNAGVAHPLGEALRDVAASVDGPDRDEVRARYPVKTGGALDIGGGMIVGPGLVVGLAMTLTSTSEPADLTIELSHPMFHPTLTATAKTESLRRAETGMHVEFGYAIPTRKRLAVMVFGGPSYFRVSQPMIVDFVADETFDARTRVYTAVVSDPVTERKTGGAWGYHVGTDVSVPITRFLSVGALARYSGATVSLDDPFQSVLRDRPVKKDVEVGGAQVSAGVRFRF
jgi:hypothetical protein